MPLVYDSDTLINYPLSISILYLITLFSFPHALNILLISAFYNSIKLCTYHTGLYDLPIVFIIGIVILSIFHTFISLPSSDDTIYYLFVLLKLTTDITLPVCDFGYISVTYLYFKSIIPIVPLIIPQTNLSLVLNVIEITSPFISND
jgi:hypothetical protein